jgi:pristinamycin I synthase 3 and 4
MDNADVPTKQLLFLSPSEQRQISVGQNGANAGHPANVDNLKDKLVHEVFEEQVEKRPDSVALTYEDQSLSYAELNVRANRLAWRLRGLGVGPEVRVAICVERSVEMVVAVLATLKAGGAYVPLDPAYPQERLAYMLEDSAPLVLLTHDNARAAMAGRAPSIPILNLDSDAPQWAGQYEHNPDHDDAGPDARRLAYIIYTSGSTGSPKGVMVEHRGLRNTALAQQVFAADPESRVLQLASFSFDASVFELTLALCGGALIVVPPCGAVLAGEALARTVNRYEISHMVLSPTALASLPQNASLDSVHMLMVASEAITREQVQRWAPGRRMANSA